jgi:predicted esterase
MRSARLRQGLLVAACAALLVVGLPALLYVLVAETAQARILALGFVAMLTVGPSLLVAARRCAAAGFVLGSLMLLVGFSLTPTAPLADVQLTSGVGSPRPARIAAQAISHFSGAYAYPRFSIANVVPELDQVKFGTYLVPFVDPLISNADAARLRASAMQVYRAAEADPQFNQMGSAMQYAYRDVDSGHLFAYSPVRDSGEKLPVLLFLHGSGGNFKVYTHMLKTVADRNHMVVVSPSFGFGNWQEAGGTAAIERARQFAITQLGGDASKVLLVGLSNGGRGVTRAIAEHGDAYAGVFFLSAVVEPAVVLRPEFGAHVRGKCTGLVYGEQDDRIPAEYMENAIAQVKAAGAKVITHPYANRDHFLFFTESAPVLMDIADFATGALAHCIFDEATQARWRR